MKGTAIRIKILSLYAREDVALYSAIAPYLEQLKLNDFINNYERIEVEELHIINPDERRLIESADILLMLITPNVTTSKFARDTSLLELIKSHNLKRHHMIPLYFYQCDLENTWFRNIPRLYANLQPLVNEHTTDMHRGLMLAFKEIETITEKIQDYKSDVEANWAQVQAAEDYEAYQQFLADYPYSKYAPEARKLAQIIVEDKLWKEAELVNKIENYCAYLNEAPFKHHKKDAIEKIKEIEKSQDVAREDALGNKSIALLLDYKRRYEKKGFDSDIDNHLFKLMSNYLYRLEGAKSIKSEGYALNYMVYANASPDEMLAMDLYLDYGVYLSKRLKALISKISALQSSYLLFGGISLLIVLYMFIFQFQALFILSNFNFIFYLITIFLLFFIYRCSIGYMFAQEDTKRFKAMQTRVTLDTSLMKLTIATHNYRELHRILLTFINAQVDAKYMEEIEMWSYITERERNVPAKKKAVIMERLKEG